MTTKSDKQSLTLEFDLPHPPAKVWRALTEPELLAKWLMKTDFQTAIGQRFSFKMPPTPGWDGVIDCEMKAIEPPARLSYSWSSMGLETLITWTLVPTREGGTLLCLEQSGFPVEKGKLPFFEGAKMGWQNMAGKRLPELLKELT